MRFSVLRVTGVFWGLPPSPITRDKSYFYYLRMSMVCNSHNKGFTAKFVQVKELR